MAKLDALVEIDDDEDEKSVSEEEVVIVEEAPDDEDDDKPLKSEDDEVDDEREAIRERRRKEKHARKDRRDTAIKRDKTELDFLRSRNDDLERRVSLQEKKSQQVEISSIEQQIASANKEAQMADRVIAKAVENNNGEDVAKAMKYRDQALAKSQQLSLYKQQTSQAPAPPSVDERTMHYAKRFMEDNPWYDSQGRDEDSAIVMAIDQALAKDGYNPQTEEYWDELRHRAARRMPERFDDDELPAKPARKARGGPAVGSGREHAPSSTRKEIYISPERKSALVEAGVWDDPVLRMKYVKRYAAYDKENS